MCARSDFTELGDKGGEQGRVACLPEWVYAQLAKNVMLKRLFPAGCHEGGCGSDSLWLKPVLVRPVVGANELFGLLGGCEEGIQGAYQARREFSAETGCLPLGARVVGGCKR